MSSRPSSIQLFPRRVVDAMSIVPRVLLLPQLLLLLLLLFVSLNLFLDVRVVAVDTNVADADAMRDLLEKLSGSEDLGWSSTTDPCSWRRVTCSDGRVVAVQVGNYSLAGTLPASVGNLTSLTRLELQQNSISGPLPSLKGLSALQVLLLHDNFFTSMPSDFFAGMSSLQAVSIDHNPFEPWELPDSLKDANIMVNFSANSVNLTGGVPEFFAGDVFPSLNHLALANNLLVGPLPSGFAGSSLTSLWLNQGGGGGGLSGSLDVIANMTNLNQLWLHSNNFSGPLPDFSGMMNLQDLQLRDNKLTGPVPESLVSLKSLKKVILSNNLLQGSVPVFSKDATYVDVDPATESFCLPNPGACDPRVNVLLSVSKSFGYPQRFAQSWKGNDPCSNWLGISCDRDGNVTVVNFIGMGLCGSLSPDFSLFPSLQKLLLSGNNITGTIPESLTSLVNLKLLDLSNNSLYGKVPIFRNGVVVNTDGNSAIGKEIGGSPGPGSGTVSGGNGSSASPSGGEVRGEKKSSIPIGPIVGSVVAGIVMFILAGLVAFCMYKRNKNSPCRVQSPNTILDHPNADQVKVSIASYNMNAGNGKENDIFSFTHGSASDYALDAGHMVIPIQVLRNVTNNFNSENILGQGGFGTVYKGELHDGTKIAVKRMESGVIGSKATNEFTSEIAVLTKVRHRHLVSLLGYCLDGNEKLLVYEYMPQGTLSQHLFNWAEKHLKPLNWKTRLSIALDVARGVEYLHTLANQSFIHRDLKPSNILLDHDMRAKVADFGLVRLAPDGKCSVETRLAGTFGYLAPEYAVTGRVTTKADVFSFGVILMELITGRRALDESRSEESVHLVTWFRRMQINKDFFHKIIDPVVNLDDETLASVNTVAELAGHCCAREPYQRPEMGYAVNVLSTLSEMWKPTDSESLDEIYGIDLNMTLPQALKKWQALEENSHSGASSSSFPASMENTQSSIPTRPSGFADSFTSADGR